jgi:bacterioferritin-associated ferredoxin
MSSNNANPEDEVICLCSGTKRSDIERWFGQGLDMEAISRKTGALSGCAGCEWDISELLKNLAENKAAADEV